MLELLSPAGEMEKLKTAIYFGADAVYVAGKNFGLRAFAGNFELDELKEATLFCHQKNKKIYWKNIIILVAFCKNQIMFKNGL